MMNLNGELRDRFAAVWNVFFSLKLKNFSFSNFLT